MLQASIGKFSGTSQVGTGNIYSKRFNFGQKLLGSRSPHCCMGNVWVATNSANQLIDKYINTTQEIVCINSIGENILQRLNGCDFDSDTVLLTDNNILLNSAIKNYDKWLVPTNLVEAKKIQRHYTKKDLADLDVKTSVNKIGEIINLSQKLNSILWHKLNNGATFEDVSEIYVDICQLSVMSNIEIDKAKKEFDISNTEELAKISEKYKYDENGVRTEPMFLGVIAKRKAKHEKYKNCFNKKKVYVPFDTSMDYLEEELIKFRRNKMSSDYIKFSDIINFDGFNAQHVWYPQIHKIIELVRESNHTIKQIWKSDNTEETSAKNRLTIDIKENITHIFNRLKIGLSSMLYLLNLIEKKEYSDIKGQIFLLLFNNQNLEFFKLLKLSKGKISTISYSEDGELELYGIKFIYN